MAKYKAEKGEDPKPDELESARNYRGQWVKGVIRDSRFGCPTGCIEIIAEQSEGAKLRRGVHHSDFNFGGGEDGQLEVSPAFAVVTSRQQVNVTENEREARDEGGDSSFYALAPDAKKRKLK